MTVFEWLDNINLDEYDDPELANSVKVLKDYYQGVTPGEARQWAQWDTESKDLQTMAKTIKAEPTPEARKFYDSVSQPSIIPKKLEQIYGRMMTPPDINYDTREEENAHIAGWNACIAKIEENLRAEAIAKLKAHCERERDELKYLADISAAKNNSDEFGCW